MPLPRADIEASLKRRGFLLEQGDHRFYALLVGGKKTGISTKISQGTKYKDYSDDLVGRVAVELKLTKRQFVDPVKCPLRFEDYVEVLRGQGLLDADEVPAPLPAEQELHFDSDPRNGKLNHLGRAFTIRVRDAMTREVAEGDRSLGVFTAVSDSDGWRAYAPEHLQAIADAWLDACRAAGVDP